MSILNIEPSNTAISCLFWFLDHVSWSLLMWHPFMHYLILNP